MQVADDGQYHLAPGVQVAVQALHWQATASGGPGGQHVNTTHSAVLLHLAIADLQGLKPAQQARLRSLAGSRLRNDDVLVLRCDQHRVQGQNKAQLLQRLTRLVQQALQVAKKRLPSKPSRAAKERRLQAKKELSQRKQRRRGSPGSED